MLAERERAIRAELAEKQAVMLVRRAPAYWLGEKALAAPTFGCLPVAILGLLGAFAAGGIGFVVGGGFGFLLTGLLLSGSERMRAGGDRVVNAEIQRIVDEQLSIARVAYQRLQDERQSEIDAWKSTRERELVAWRADEIGQVSLFEKANFLDRFLQRIDESEFEDLVAVLFELDGFETRTKGGTGDGGVDVIARKGTSLCVVIQCKRYNGTSIGGPVIRDLLGAAADHQRSAEGARIEPVLATTFGVFTPQARDVIDRNNVRILTALEVRQLIRSTRLLHRRGEWRQRVRDIAME